METRFEVAATAEKELFREFGALHMKNKKQKGFILAAGLLALFFGFPYSVWMGSRPLAVLFAVTGVYLMCYCAGLMEFMMSASMYHNFNTKLRDTEMTYRFGDDGFEIVERLGSSRSSYEAITTAAESDRAYLLMTAGNAGLLLPKSGFRQGSPEEFRSFLEEKTGKPVPYYKLRRGRIRPWIVFAVSVLWLIAVQIGVKTVKKRLDSIPVRMSAAGFSIELPQDFRLDSDTEFDFTAHNREVYIWAGQQAIQEEATASEMGQLLYERLEESQDPKLETLSDGTVCVTFTSTVEGEAYYYCDALVQTEDAFWVAEFICSAELQEDYAQVFFQWAQTIEVQS